MGRIKAHGSEGDFILILICLLAYMFRDSAAQIAGLLPPSGTTALSYRPMCLSIKFHLVDLVRSGQCLSVCEAIYFLVWAMSVLPFKSNDLISKLFSYLTYGHDVCLTNDLTPLLIAIVF